MGIKSADQSSQRRLLGKRNLQCRGWLSRGGPTADNTLSTAIPRKLATSGVGRRVAKRPLRLVSSEASNDESGHGRLTFDAAILMPTV
jgi:hypothetical protein